MTKIYIVTSVLTNEKKVFSSKKKVANYMQISVYSLSHIPKIMKGYLIEMRELNETLDK